MSTHIVFFDTTITEKESFEKYFSGSEFSVKFFAEPIEEVPAYEVKDAEIVSVYITSHVDEKLLAYMPKLKMVACRSTGFDNVGLGALKKRGIAVTNVPGYGKTTVAEYAFLLMLALARKLPQTLDSFRTGQVDYPHLTGFTLKGKTLGVVGSGKIGQSVISIAKAFGMNVVAFDPFPNNDLPDQLHFKYVGLSELLRVADIVTLHAPMTKENMHLIDSSSFKLMKKGALLINTARGELVDTKALIGALKDHKIAGAALDVLEGEQVLELDNELELYRAGKKDIGTLVVEHDILSKMNNVILSPHNAFNSREALEFIRKTSAENIKGFITNQPQNLVK